MYWTGCKDLYSNIGLPCYVRLTDFVSNASLLQNCDETLYQMLIYYRIVMKPSGDIGIFDPTEIHNRQQLKNYMRESLIRLGIHLIFFFIFLYWYVICTLCVCIDTV